MVQIPELYSPQTNTWQSLTQASNNIPVYPFIYQLPDGRIAWLGASEGATQSEVLNLQTNQWSTIDSRIVDGGSIANYAPGKFIKAGSAADDGFSGNSLKTAYTLNMNTPGATWQPTESMSFPRSFLNLTNLPDGTVLATGGGTDKSGFNDSNAVMQAEDWDPSSGNWTTYASMSAPRLYHSVAVLLPDGRVYVAGGGGADAVVDQRSAQIFSPPYLFKGPRPSIASAPSTVAYGKTEFVGTPDAASISRVSLIRTGSVTHAFDENARATSLNFTQTAGGLNISMPSNRNDVPPGYYMLFIVNNQGVPSVASFVRFPRPLRRQRTADRADKPESERRRRLRVAHLDGGDGRHRRRPLQRPPLEHVRVHSDRRQQGRAGRRRLPSPTPGWPPAPGTTRSRPKTRSETSGPRQKRRRRP